MKYYFSVFKNFDNFSGRARRKEYWMFFLFNMLASLIMMLLDNLLNLSLNGTTTGLLSGTYAIIAFFPSLAVTIRRLHDIGKSGWWYFFVLIPIVGGIVLLIWLCQEGSKERNKWGNNPKNN